MADARGPSLVPWSVHDLRRTVATGLQRLGVRLEVTEAVLNHISGSRAGIAGVYQRHDWAAEKRAALDAWAPTCSVRPRAGARPAMSSRWDGQAEQRRSPFHRRNAPKADNRPTTLCANC